VTKEIDMPPKKVTGSKKTDALTLRLDPKHKYLIELTSRLDRKSITGVIETAVQRLAQDRELEFSQRKMTLTAAVEFLWSPDEAERVTNLAQHAPFLLTHEESCIRTVLLDASELFFNCYEVYGKEDLEYRRYAVLAFQGIFLPDENGETLFLTPRMRTVKLAWELIVSRAAHLAEKGTYTPLSAKEVEDFIGRPLASIKPEIKMPKDGGMLDEGSDIGFRGSDRFMDDTLELLGQKPK